MHRDDKAPGDQQKPEINRGLPQDVKNAIHEMAQSAIALAIKTQAFDLDGPAEKIKELREQCPDLGFDDLGAINNKVYAINGAESVASVILIAVHREWATSAYAKLTEGDIRPKWLPESFYRRSGDFYDNGYRVNSTLSVEVIERCPTNLSKYVKQLHSKDDNFDKRIHDAMNIGMQLSDFLSDIRRKGLIYTDMKPGNILLRANIKIVIADLKAIQDPAKLLKLKTGEIEFTDVSPPFLSESFRRNNLESTKSPEAAIAAWEKEYSYQLAVQLHFVLTGNLRETPANLADCKETKFDFSHPIFQTDAGKNMKYIIKRLGDNDPAKRIRHADAKELLKVVKDPQQFKEMRAQAEKNVVKGVSLMKSVTPEEAKERLKAAEKIQAAQAALRADKAKYIEAQIDERKAREVAEKEKSMRTKIAKGLQALNKKVDKSGQSTVAKPGSARGETKEKENAESDNRHGMKKT